MEQFRRRSVAPIGGDAAGVIDAGEWAVKSKAIYVTLMLFALSAPAVAQGFEPGTMPPREIMRMLRQTGFEPMSRPMRRGPNYVVFAIDNRDREVRLLVAAHTGAIVSVTPMQTAARMPPRGGASMGPYERMPPGYVPPAGYPRGGSVYEDDDDAPPPGPYGLRPPAPVPGVPPASGSAAPPPRVGSAVPPPRVGSVMPQDDDEPLPPRSGMGGPPPRSGPAVIPADPDRGGMLPPPPERFPQRAAPAPEKPKPVIKRAAAAPPKQTPLPKPKPEAKVESKTSGAAAEAPPAAKSPPPESWPGSKPETDSLPN
jgi:hypothetical protein